MSWSPRKQSVARAWSGRASAQVSGSKLRARGTIIVFIQGVVLPYHMMSVVGHHMMPVVGRFVFDLSMCSLGRSVFSLTIFQKSASGSAFGASEASASPSPLAAVLETGGRGHEAVPVYKILHQYGIFHDASKLSFALNFSTIAKAKSSHVLGGYVEAGAKLKACLALFQSDSGMNFLDLTLGGRGPTYRLALLNFGGPRTRS